MDSHIRLFYAQHPGDPRLVMSQYRKHILGCKKSWGTARSLIHYQRFIDAYLLAKRRVLSA